MILFQRIPSVRALFVLCVGLLLFSACSLNQAASGSQERVVLTPLATITPVPTAVLDQPTLTLAGEDPMTEPTATVEEPTGVPTAVPPTAEPTATEEPAADEPVATEEAGSSEPAGDDGLTQVDFGQLVDYTHPSELFSLLLPGAWDIVSESTELPILLRVRPPGMITAIARVDVLVDQDPERALLSREDFIAHMQADLEGMFGNLPRFSLSEPEIRPDGSIVIGFTFVDLDQSPVTVPMQGLYEGRVDSDYVSLLTIAVPEEQYAQHQPTIEQIVQSYQLNASVVPPAAETGDDSTTEPEAPLPEQTNVLTFGQEIATLSGHAGGLWGVTFHPDGSLLASASNDMTVKLWDVASLTELKTLSGHTGGVRAVAFSPDGSMLATGSIDTSIKLWSVPDGEEIATLTGHSDEVAGLAWSPDGKQLVSGSKDTTALIWDVASRSVLRTLPDHQHWVESVDWSPDGSLIVSGSLDNTVKLWNAVTGVVSQTLYGHTHWVLPTTFSPDGSMVASGSADTGVRVWSVETGQELLTLWGYTNEVRSVAFSPDGSLLASGSEDETAQIWRMPAGEPVITLEPGSSAAWVVFSPDGQTLAMALGNGQIKLWHVGR